MAKAKSQQTEVHEYQAEMQRLLDILVHSLYTDRDIFLRELVSNASDALSKVQLMTLTEGFSTRMRPWKLIYLSTTRKTALSSKTVGAG